MLTVPSRVLKAVAKAASSETGRYAIDGIHVRVDGMIEATDGRWMLRGKGEICGGEAPTESIILASEIPNILRDPLVKKRGNVALVLNGTAHHEGFAGNVPVARHDSKAVTFPDTDGVMPSKREGTRNVIGISATILKALAEACSAVVGDMPCVRFTFSENADGSIDATRVIHVEFGQDQNKVEGVVMPMSL